MASLDSVARAVIPRLAPYLDERVAALAQQYVDEGEPVMGLEQAVLSLEQSQVLVGREIIDSLVEAVDKRAADGGSVEFLRGPLAGVRRER